MAIHFLWTFLITTGALLIGAAILQLLPRAGGVGRRISAAFCNAPALDLPITYFTVVPLFVGPIVAGWAGLLGGLCGQAAALILWTIFHELTHPDARKPQRIIFVINRDVGAVQNMLAAYLTGIVVPLFWFIRMAEIFVYPGLTWLVRLPAYKQGEWVNVSRQKFQGLVGHDLIWCLYCDWMTGVWSLATEMLRNVESFWCPIRFASGKKCENCALDFPDINNGWVPADGTMGDVVQVIQQHYPPNQNPRGWFGHPVRITVKGAPVEPEHVTA
jgi:hypothetical protein